MQKMKKKFNPKKAAPVKKSEEPEGKSDKLTEKNLKILDKEVKSKEKPKWALTEEEAEIQEYKEGDELLDFVQALDYDAFIDDLEVRQALEIVKERIEEIKKDKEWKQNIAAKYNNNNDDEDEDKDKQSAVSKGSMKSYVSKARSQIEKNLEGEKKNEADWDRSVIII